MLTPRRAQRSLNDKMEAGLVRAASRHEAATEKLDRKLQRAKYNSGAAKSPTPPPRKSLTRDRQAIELLKIIEMECYDRRGSVSVEALSQRFLFEQCVISEDKLTEPVKSDDKLREEVARLGKMGHLKEARKVLQRLAQRFSRAGGRKEVRVYGWDKTTFLLKSCFVSWAMSPALAVPFTVNLSKEAVLGASKARTSFASHLQSRLQKILKRRFDGKSPEFWFVIEQGTKGGYHLHGAIECEPGKKDRSTVRQALQTLSGSDAFKAVHLGALAKRLGWASYCLKHVTKTRHSLREQSVFACTSGARKAGQALYERFHAEIRLWKSQ